MSARLSQTRMIRDLSATPMRQLAAPGGRLRLPIADRSQCSCLRYILSQCADFTPAITSRRVNAPPEKPRFAARLALPRLLDAARIPGKQSPQGRIQAVGDHAFDQPAWRTELTCFPNRIAGDHARDHVAGNRHEAEANDAILAHANVGLLGITNMS